MPPRGLERFWAWYKEDAVWRCWEELECLIRAHKAYAIGVYNRLGPNSDAYTWTLRLKCGGCGGDPRAFFRTPGWGDKPPAPIAGAEQVLPTDDNSNPLERIKPAENQFPALVAALEATLKMFDPRLTDQQVRDSIQATLRYRRKTTEEIEKWSAEILRSGQFR